MPGPLRFTLGNHLAELERARRAVLEFVAPESLPARTVYRIELVLEEILTNIMRHSLRNAPTAEIALTVTSGSDGVTLTFEDPGPPFNPLEHAEPAAPASIDDARVGGWGISLVRGFADGLHYDRIEGRNALKVRIAADR